MTVNVFAVPVFLVVFRETLETVIIVSVLLAFLKQTLDGGENSKTVYKKLVRQVSRLPIDCQPGQFMASVMLIEYRRSGSAQVSASSYASSSAQP